MIRELFYKFRISMLFISLSLVMAACSTVPITGRSQFLMTSQAEERQLGEQARGLGQAILSEMTDPKYRELAVAIYGGATTVGVMLPYSRTHEYEADHIGLIYMARAGYDPKYAITFWEKFSKASSVSGMEEFLSTHPIGEKRIQQMQELLPTALDEYDKAKVKRGAGVVYK